MYENGIRGLLTKKRIFIAVAVTLLVALIVTLLNIRIVSVTTNAPSELSLHETDQDPVYADVAGNTARLTHWGSSFSVSARNAFQEAMYTNSGGFSLNPFVSVSLTVKPQATSSKIASNGDKCVLYTNIPEDSIIVSDCVTNTATNVRIIKNGVRETPILPDVTLFQTSPAPEGFYYVASNGEDSNKFDVNLYSFKTSLSKKVLEAQSVQPKLVTNESTGYFGGAIVGDKYYSVSNLSNSNKKSVRLTYSNEGQGVERLFGLNSSGLYVYSTLKKIRSEESPEKSTKQNMQLFDVSSGEQIFSKKAGTKSNVLQLVTTSATASLRTENPKEPVKTFGKEGELKTHFTSTDLLGGQVFINNNFYFVSGGSVWSVQESARSRSLNLIYAADEINVTNIAIVGDKVIISADSVKNGGVALVNNFELNLTKDAQNNKRIESILPIMNWSDNLLYADVYRDVISVNYQKNNQGITESPETTFSKLGIKNINSYRIKINDPAYFEAQNTNPTNSSKTDFSGAGEDGRDDLNPDLQ